MSEDSIDKSYANDILGRLFEPKDSLRELYTRRLEETELSFTNSATQLGIAPRTLNGILDGTQKLIDLTKLAMIASFLQMPTQRIIQLYLEALERNFPQEVKITTEKIKFIQQNFDLGILKRAGFIDSIVDYNQAEEKIVKYLGLKSIYHYKKPVEDVAFSAGVITPKNDLTRGFWINAAKTAFEELCNPYPFDREGVIKYFPEIRWHSTNVELGLMNVMAQLYRLGVSVIYLSSLPSIHLRGATFSVYGKPCIVLTDYRGFYPTLWFSLVHELFHVLFDWDEISNNQFHLSDSEINVLSVIEKEEEANNFAREYLFSKEKTSRIRPYLYDERYVAEFARKNQVHPSFIYVFNAYDLDSNHKRAWGMAFSHNPDISLALRNFANPWDNPTPIAEFISTKKQSFFNLK